MVGAVADFVISEGSSPLRLSCPYPTRSHHRSPSTALHCCACSYARYTSKPTKFFIYSSRGHPFRKGRDKFLTHCAHCAQDLQFLAESHTIRNRNRPAKQVW